MSPSIYYHHALLYIMTCESSDEVAPPQHSSYAKRFYNSLSNEKRRKRAERYPQKSLFLPHSSQWRKFFMSHDDQTYITLIGLDVKSSKIVCKKFANFFNCLTQFDKDTPNITQKLIKSWGRPRNVGLKIAWHYVSVGLKPEGQMPPCRLFLEWPWLT